MPRRYHHGELRSALITGALQVIADKGLRGFSVAEAARRVGVSTAAPYRHFADRESLLAAVGGTVADDLAEWVRRATARYTDPVDQLAAAAGSYTEFMIENRAGLHVIFASDLGNSRNDRLHQSRRSLMDRFLALAFAASPDTHQALELMEQLLAQAHGYATFHLDGVFTRHGYDTELVVHKSVQAARIVITERTRRDSRSAGDL